MTGVLLSIFTIATTFFCLVWIFHPRGLCNYGMVYGVCLGDLGLWLMVTICLFFLVISKNCYQSTNDAVYAIRSLDLFDNVTLESSEERHLLGMY